MAKQKKQTEENSNISQIDNLLAEIDKKYGNVMKSGDDIINNPPMTIPFSPCLNKILGGGITEATWNLVSGMPKTGKTTGLLTFCANAQLEQYGKRHICILSVEHRLDQQTLLGIKGLKTDVENLTFVESQKGKQLSTIDFLEIGLLFLKNVPGGVLLIDSVSALTNPSIMEKGIGASDFGSNNKLFSQFVDLAVPIVKSNKNIILMVAQVYTNTSGFGRKTSEKIALKGKFQADVILEVVKSEFDYANGDTEPPVGQSQTWLCKKAVLTSPMKKTESYLRYGVGIDKTRELITLGSDFGLITVKGGGWTTLAFLTEELKKGTDYEESEDVKIQGTEAAYQLLETHPTWLEALESGVNEILNPSAAKQ